MNLIKVGPAGRPYGSVWEEKEKGELAKIFLFYDDTKIYSLQFLFIQNDNFVLSDIHGSPLQRMFTSVVLDYTSEFLTLVSGTCDDESFGLTSITFGTNKGTYGPYGSKKNSPYEKEIKLEIGKDRSFGGFHGTKTDNCIESIGVYLKTVTSSMIIPRRSQSVGYTAW
ncbi:jacalin-related lectin 2-like isoform X1 [Capsicum galapagoense]